MTRYLRFIYYYLRLCVFIKPKLQSLKRRAHLSLILTVLALASAIIHLPPETVWVLLVSTI